AGSVNVPAPIPAGRQTGPAPVYAGTPVPAGRQNRPAPVHAVTPPDGAWTEHVSGGVTLLSISSTKHKERPLRIIEFSSRDRQNRIKRSSYDRVMAKTVNRCREALSLSLLLRLSSISSVGKNKSIGQRTAKQKVKVLLNRKSRYCQSKIEVLPWIKES
ncbi:hypothetical protein Tco_0281778, partial [Tanacetum coccineum]